MIRKIKLPASTDIHLFSILAGGAACNARCPFCVSKMTPRRGVSIKEPKVEWKNFEKACDYARKHGAKTAMITGKGEPSLFPNQITKYLPIIKKYGFEKIELQTNGILMAENKSEYEHYLRVWHENGLSLIAISVVHYESGKNRQIYLPHKKNYIDLPALISFLHKKERRFSVRLSCILLHGFIDSPNRLKELIKFAGKNRVEQLTIRPVNKPEKSENEEVRRWMEKNRLAKAQKKDIRNYLEGNGKNVLRLPHRATVYDVNGQNVCLTNSLTKDDLKTGYLRQLIFFPDGHLRADWEEGAEVIL